MQRSADEHVEAGSVAAEERELHDALGRWAEDHAQRYPGIEVLPYAPDRFPGQHIDTSVTRTRFEDASASFTGLDERLRAEFEKTLGVRASEAREAIEPWVDDLKRLLGAGRNVVVLTAHADLIHDIGIFSGGLAISLGDVGLIKRNGTILNRVMSREMYADLPVAELFASFANVYWVIPETESAAKWGISDELASTLNAQTMRTLLTDMRHGMLLTVAPTGTAMRPTVDAAGAVAGFTIPHVSPSTANLVGRFDAYALGGVLDGRVGVSPIRELPKIDAESRAERRSIQEQRIVEIMEEMVALVATLTDVPVAYEGS